MDLFYYLRSSHNQCLVIYFIARCEFLSSNYHVSDFNRKMIVQMFLYDWSLNYLCLKFFSFLENIFCFIPLLVTNFPNVMSSNFHSQTFFLSQVRFIRIFTLFLPKKIIREMIFLFIFVLSHCSRFSFLPDLAIK